PDILILDEPMSGLDPVGAETMREALLDLRRQGKTLVLSSHQMEAVEKICDAIALINRGQKLLDGHNNVILAYEGDGGFLAELPGVRGVADHGRYAEIQLADGADPQALLRE